MKGIWYWYDGFVFGGRAGIYHPWSITMYLDSREYGTWWADTSANALVSELIRTGTPELRMQMEALLTDDLDYMNQYMNEVAEKLFSSFDVGRKPSEKKRPDQRPAGGKYKMRCL